MGKITINEMHNSLFDYAQAVSDEDLMTENKTIVGAINEIYGKKLIADSIGEPLNNTDTFTKMSNDINGLLSTFKTNMMNAGVVIESGDKFKSLIDKIKGLTEGEGNKGIQFAEGAGSFTSKSDSNYDITLDTPFGFLPTYVFIEFPTGYASMNVTQSIADNGAHYVTYSSSGGVSGYAKSFNDTSVTIYCLSTRSALIEYKWYAIGVGEEDTTLRDSLASILENKGVEVTEEDDMASLISKVDQKLDESGGGLDIISATELPAIANDNQICVIMDEPCDNFIVTSESNPNLSESTVVLHTSSSGNAVTLTNGNITTCLLFDSVYMRANKYASYVYKSSQWEQLTALNLPILTNGVASTNVIGSLRTSNTLAYSEGNYIYCSGGTAGLYAISSWYNMIDFDSYSTIKFTAYTSSSSYSSNIVFAQSDTVLSTYDSNSITNFISNTCKYSSTLVVNTTTANEYIIDISSWTGTYYLAIQVYQTLINTYITNIELI